jgi:hypothetical protein
VRLVGSYKEHCKGSFPNFWRKRNEISRLRGGLGLRFGANDRWGRTVVSRAWYSTPGACFPCTSFLPHLSCHLLLEPLPAQKVNDLPPEDERPSHQPVRGLPAGESEDKSIFPRRQLADLQVVQVVLEKYFLRVTDQYRLDLTLTYEVVSPMPHLLSVHDQPQHDCEKHQYQRFITMPSAAGLPTQCRGFPSTASEISFCAMPERVALPIWTGPRR